MRIRFEVNVGKSVRRERVYVRISAGPFIYARYYLMVTRCKLTDRAL